MDIEKNLKEAFGLISTNNHIIAYGNGLYVFTKKGALLFKNKTLKYIYKVAILPNNQIMVDCGKLRKYILISLDDGTELYRIEQPRMHSSPPKFTVSKDGRFVYDFFFYANTYSVIKMDVCEGSSEIVLLSHGLYATRDMICDNDGNLCILQCQIEEIAERTINIGGIRYEYFDHCFGAGRADQWKAKWYYPHRGHSPRFFGSVDKLIAGTFIFDIFEQGSEPIFKVINGEELIVPQLENGEDVLLKSDPQYCETIDERYILLYCTDSNIIVDRMQNKIIARYFTEAKGCIVDDEFWMCSKEGFMRKKFPLIEGESLRPKPVVFWYGKG